MELVFILAVVFIEISLINLPEIMETSYEMSTIN